MRGIKLVPLCFGSLSAIAFALAVPSATAQEPHGHNVCREVGAFTPEQLGDREGHALVDWAIKLPDYRRPRGRRSSDRNKHVGMGWAEGERAFRFWRFA